MRERISPLLWVASGPIKVLALAHLVERVVWRKLRKWLVAHAKWREHVMEVLHWLFAVVHGTWILFKLEKGGHRKCACLQDRLKQQQKKNHIR